MDKRLNYEFLDSIGCDGCNITSDDFLIVDSWESLEKIEKCLGHDLDDLTDDKWGFNDEYSTCDDCAKAIRTIGDSYHWTPKFEIIDGGIYYHECLTNEDIVELCINNPNKANTILTDEDLENEGFEKYNDDYYENGWYGQEDKPNEIYDNLKDKFDEILFSIHGQEQFRTTFDVWVKVVD